MSVRLSAGAAIGHLEQQHFDHSAAETDAIHLVGDFQPIPPAIRVVRGRDQDRLVVGAHRMEEHRDLALPCVRETEFGEQHFLDPLAGNGQQVRVNIDVADAGGLVA